tara:strand:- start:2094 stop:2627 length:534 start_codon:yes stop_codon:yes gene_type:complete
MIEMRKQVEPGSTTPPEISVMQIDQDLKNGITKAEMAVKYNIKPWEVDEMFKHPFLKGRRPSRKKALSFKFVDDSPIANTPVAQETEVDPRQVTLEQAIDEAIETVEDAKQEMQEAEKAIVDMLSPTQFETPQETLQNAAVNTINDLHQAVEKSGGEVISTDNDEEELEMDDDTFEL